MLCFLLFFCPLKIDGKERKWLGGEMYENISLIIGSWSFLHALTESSGACLAKKQDQSSHFFLQLEAVGQSIWDGFMFNFRGCWHVGPALSNKPLTYFLVQRPTQRPQGCPWLSRLSRQKQPCFGTEAYTAMPCQKKLSAKVVEKLKSHEITNITNIDQPLVSPMDPRRIILLHIPAEQGGLLIPFTSGHRRWPKAWFFHVVSLVPHSKLEPVLENLQIKRTQLGDHVWRPSLKMEGKKKHMKTPSPNHGIIITRITHILRGCWGFVADSWHWWWLRWR